MHPLLAENVQDFLREHANADARKLALARNPFPHIALPDLINQIAARQKARTKLPSWFAATAIVYPPKISIEQSSSEATARYKATLVSGSSLMDLTGGFGVDDFYFAKQMRHVLHCEMNEELSEIVAHNFKMLGADNISCIAQDSSAYLQKSDETFDWIYVDPSRRHDAKGKVFLLSDCAPNVPELLDLYFAHAPHLMIKTAPLLDLSAGLLELRHVKEIQVVALENEVKELLWILERGYTGNALVTAVNLTQDAVQSLTFEPGAEVPVQYALPQVGQYLYEPNAALMKAAAFDIVSERFEVAKLHPHAHLYVSHVLLDFPGRRFRIEHIIDYDKASMKTHLEKQKANITTRHFPESVETLRKKWKIADGGDRYCFFTTNQNNRKIVLLCAKI